MRPRNMHRKSDNIEITMRSETNDIIEELCEYLLQRYQKGLEESMRGSEFIFDGVDLLYYNLQKISLNRKGSSYIYSPKWLKNKKTTINKKNNDNNCFRYALTVPLDYIIITLKKTLKEHQKLSLLLISMIGKK